MGINWETWVRVLAEAKPFYLCPQKPSYSHQAPTNHTHMSIDPWQWHQYVSPWSWGFALQPLLFLQDTMLYRSVQCCIWVEIFIIVISLLPCYSQSVRPSQWLVATIADGPSCGFFTGFSIRCKNVNPLRESAILWDHKVGKAGRKPPSDSQLATWQTLPEIVRKERESATRAIKHCREWGRTPANDARSSKA